MRTTYKAHTPLGGGICEKANPRGHVTVEGVSTANIWPN
jgi:hypothetical protein